jgi:dTDP-4-dehydrorhamnose reductase
MRLLLTGAAGMLATAVRQTAPAGVRLEALTRHEFDIGDAAAVTTTIARLKPEWVINCAAYTAVDRAETEPDSAYHVNTAGPLHLATAVRRAGGRLLHLSTDYVFDGARDTPYREDDATRPLSVYGRSKLAGEHAVRDILPERHLIVRSQWLFGPGGRNFVTTILDLAAQRQPLRVVNDQFGRPSHAPDLARAIWRLVERDARGTVHVANEGSASWFDLATAAVAAAGIGTIVEPCRTEDVPRPAPRPKFSVLDCSRFLELTGQRLPPWRAAVRSYVASVLGLQPVDRSEPAG